jgi:hypothetical protein
VASRKISREWTLPGPIPLCSLAFAADGRHFGNGNGTI